MPGLIVSGGGSGGASAASVLSYGARGNGTTDDTAAIQAALNANAGQSIAFPNGSYKVTSTISVPAGCTLDFESIILVVGAATSSGIFGISTTDVSIRGKIIVSAGGFQTPIFCGTSGGNNFTSDAHCLIAGASSTPSANNYLFKFTQCSRTRIGGFITTTGDSPWFVYIDRGTDVDISGVQATLTANDGVYACIFVQDSTGGSGCTNINIHDCSIDGGNVLFEYAPIFVGRIQTSTNVSHVRINNCHVKNTLLLADGIDIICCTDVVVTNCTFQSVQYGLAFAGGSLFTASNCTANACRGAGFDAGDPSIPMDTVIFSFHNCIAYACGTGAVSTQYMVYAPTGKFTTVGRFVGCTAYPTGASAYAFALDQDGTGSVSDIEILGGEYVTGSSGVLTDQAGTAAAPAYRARGAKGINPGGIRTQPAAVPSSTVAATNTTGFDCTVYVYVPTGCTLTEVTIGGQALAEPDIAGSATARGGPYRVLAGQTIALTYSSGPPTWGWFGD